MTALPLQPPYRLLTVAEYAALPEDTDGLRHELQEGILVMTPRPIPDHQLCLSRISRRLEDQLPDDLEVLPEVDIDLRLVPPDEPATVRIPDLVVVSKAAVERVRRERGLLRAAEVVLGRRDPLGRHPAAGHDRQGTRVRGRGHPALLGRRPRRTRRSAAARRAPPRRRVRVRDRRPGGRPLRDHRAVPGPRRPGHAPVSTHPGFGAVSGEPGASVAAGRVVDSPGWLRGCPPAATSAPSWAHRVCQ
jgi:Putative restriction endonuclease